MAASFYHRRRGLLLYDMLSTGEVLVRVEL